MKSRMNKLMSLCLVAMMGSTLIPQPIQAEAVDEFAEESFEESTVDFEEEKQNVEASQENLVTADFEYEGLKYKITDKNKKEVQVLGFADDYHPTGNRLNISQWAYSSYNSDETGVYYDTMYEVTSIGDSAFKDCQFTTIKDITLPASLMTIGESAFAGFTSLMDVGILLPENLTTIGESAFAGCTALEGINLPEGLTTIGKSAFAGCTSLERINIPATLKTINESTFAGCTSLGYIRFDYDHYEGPSTIQLETIGDFAFKGCTSIDSVDLPEGLKTIGDSVFAGCTSIYRIELPDGLEQIGAHAFDLTDDHGKNDEPQLACINIPSTVTTLGESFLGGVCSEGGTALVFQGESLPTNMDQKALNGISGNNNKATVYFPKAGINAYAAESSPFVKVGLINPDRFDSSIEQKYETIQLCPGKWANFPSKVEYSPLITKKLISANPNIASVDENGLMVVYGKKTGETFVELVLHSNGGELVSEKPNKVKVKVEHNYVWQIEKWPTKDQPGSMFQYCLSCKNKKASVAIPPTGSSEGGSGGSSSGGGSTGGSSSGNIGGGGATVEPSTPTQQVENAVYRAYNPYNGEHLYTTNYGEFKAITKNGWDDEGIAFMSESKEKGQPLYRVYNPNDGLHHYTTDENEKNTLVSLGWNDEGIACYTSKDPKSMPVYRVYNPNGGQHHYTMDANEALTLITIGWHNEGIAFLTSPIKK